MMANRVLVSLISKTRRTSLCLMPVRKVFNLTKKFDPTFNEEKMKEIEQYWKPRIKLLIEDAQKLPKKTPTEKSTFYVLSMFPYPSGQLHMGHVRVYAISDANAYLYRMLGYNVIHPMGWDAFGLPAENAAIERGIEPQIWTRKNIESMKAQLDDLGFLFDWSREFATCDPEYYKWTQFIFKKMFDAGLAYQSESLVNWDPVDKTVLANEQVDSDGKSWRSGAKVEKRALKQWFLRTSSFSKSMYDSLSNPEMSKWRDITRIQENWIGTCDGTKFNFKAKKVKNENEELGSLSLWTDRPELVFSAGAVLIQQSNVIFKTDLCETDEFYSKSLKGNLRKMSIVVENPFNGDLLPVFYHEPSELSVKVYPDGTNCVLLLPESDENHQKILCELGISKEKVLVTSGDQSALQNSSFLNGLSIEEARSKVMSQAREMMIGGFWVSSKLGDWLISRQRYWGTPIPIVHCSTCGSVPVPEDELPVLLPEIEPSLFWSSSRSPDCKSALSLCHDWVSTTCPKCSSPAKRETDTMDTFVDSAWYFLRFLDPRNNNSPFSKESAAAMPVDLYIGGKEHATLHLYFARFITRFLHDIGLSPVKEPFDDLLCQGMVKGQSFRVKGSGKYVPRSSVEFTADQKPIEVGTGLPLVTEWEKMSKSKYNGADPGEVISQYGSDLTRLLILSDVSPLSDRLWSPQDSYVRISNMLTKLTRILSSAITLQESDSISKLTPEQFEKQRGKVWDSRNFYLRGANHAYLNTRNLSMVMGRLQGLLGDLLSTHEHIKRDCPEFQRALGMSIILLTPLAPHLSAELWSAFSSTRYKNYEGFLWGKSVFHQDWPQLDSNYNLKLNLFRNDQEITHVPVAVWRLSDLTESDALDLACGVPEIQNGVLREEFVTEYSKTKDYEASLIFKVKESEEETRRRRDERQKEKERKKLEREKRIANYGSSKKTKLSKS